MIAITHSARHVARQLVTGCAILGTAGAAAQDARNIAHGREIPSMGYADMPLVVMLNDGAWLCTLTTGPGEEGAHGQTIASTVSRDRGQTWSDLVFIEPSVNEPGHESSWAVPFHVAHQGEPDIGRVYVFYVHNGDRITEAPGMPEATRHRVDMLGWLMYRWSDDGGSTWLGPRRIEIPVTWADLNNTFGGTVQMFWGIDEPVVSEGEVLLAFTKIRRHLVGSTEGWVLASDNLLKQSDPTLHNWQMLSSGNTGAPETWRGLRSETYFAGTQAEHDLTALTKPGHLLMLNRTDKGLVSESWSKDNGRTWTEPAPARYADGSLIRHPRANVKIWTIKPGTYLLWHHNHGGTSFQDRNPAWLSVGIEKDGRILWSQPEIVLYDPDPDVRISYPDLIIENGSFSLTETQKSVARVHPLSSDLVRGLFAQFDAETEPPADALTSAQQVSLSQGEGFSIALRVPREALADGQLVAQDAAHKAWAIRGIDGDRIQIELATGNDIFRWTSGPIPSTSDDAHDIVIIIDGGPSIMTIIADGKLQDGSGERQFGWARLPESLDTFTLMPGDSGDVQIFARALTTSEACAWTRANQE